MYSLLDSPKPDDDYNMATGTESRQDPKTGSFAGHPVLTVKSSSSNGSSELAGKLLDLNDEGVSIEVGALLAPGLRVEISGEIESAAGPYRLRRKCLVCRCSAIENGKYIVGLTFEPAYGEAGGASQATAAASAGAADHYETLQLSRNANLDMIQRVFRILAQRYHPDNLETGNPELFREIVEAHRVLGDPERRAAYDAQLGAQSQNRFKIFETWQDTRGVDAEKRKRQGILSLLYGKRLTDPHSPAMSMRDFEEMLGVPREHLEFSLWFLKENKWITRADNNKFEITCAGVVMAEADEANTVRTQMAQLPAPR
ncbi:MAG TPA: J domain-containing protein [Bryobacteraceae bacterium]|nr:J domain-containing protein [Bryobacteraceae bacterium]